MKTLQSSLVRTLCAIVAGYLLAVYREQMLHWTTIAVGALFFFSGLVSVITYFSEKRRANKTADQLEMLSELRPEMATPKSNGIARSLRPSLPVVGVGSLLLGIILTLMPDTFANIMMYVVAALVMLGAVNMLVNFAGARKFSDIGWGWVVMPILLLTMAVLMVVKPEIFASMPFRIMGWTMVVYGLVECILSIRIYRYRKAWEKAQETAQEVSDVHENSTETKITPAHVSNEPETVWQH